MSDAETPDPADVEPLGADAGVYQRDSEGELKPLDPEVIEWDGDYHSVRFYPTPLGEVDEYREMGEDMSIEQICGILERKVHTPDRTADEWSDTDPGLFTAIMSKLVQKAVGEGASNEFHAEIRKELDQRGGGPGN